MGCLKKAWSTSLPWLQVLPLPPGCHTKWPLLSPSPTRAHPTCCMSHRGAPYIGQAPSDGGHPPAHLPLLNSPYAPWQHHWELSHHPSPFIPSMSKVYSGTWDCSSSSLCPRLRALVHVWAASPQLWHWGQAQTCHRQTQYQVPKTQCMQMLCLRPETCWRGWQMAM